MRASRSETTPTSLGFALLRSEWSWARDHAQPHQGARAGSTRTIGVLYQEPRDGTLRHAADHP